MRFLDEATTGIIRLAADGDLPEAVHEFTRRQIRALNAALAAKRPLLVRGEPGIGKSQLARAAAKALGRVFVGHTVDARTESRDLLWHFDAVARLAEAQLLGALCLRDPVMSADATGKARSDAAAHARDALELANFIHPRALWWAFDWKGAADQSKRVNIAPPAQADGGNPSNGCVVLIDEIDKGETDVPNGLLEALGSGSFSPQGLTDPVAAKGIAPLVIITTNEERALPDAFVRRCLVLHLRLPRDPAELKKRLVERGKVHFGRKASVALLELAADLLIADRETARENHWLPLPGQAEYLDLVRAVVNAARGAEAQRTMIEQVAEFVLKKHPDAFERVPEAQAND